MERLFHYNGKIYVSGHAGYYDKGKSIGYQRALAIKQLMVDFGLNEDSIIVEDAGLNFPTVNLKIDFYKGKCKSEKMGIDIINRRVVISTVPLSGKSD